MHLNVLRLSVLRQTRTVYGRLPHLQEWTAAIKPLARYQLAVPRRTPPVTVGDLSPGLTNRPMRGSGAIRLGGAPPRIIGTLWPRSRSSPDTACKSSSAPVSLD